MPGKQLHIQFLSKFDKLYVRDEGVCWICGEWGPPIAFNKDHLIPRSLGGNDKMWNLRIAHFNCNMVRDTDPPPLDIVLYHCRHKELANKALRMYYRAYPHLRKNPISKAHFSARIEGRKTVPISFDAGPKGHIRHRSGICSCYGWCGTCGICWCEAEDSDHDKAKAAERLRKIKEKRAVK